MLRKIFHENTYILLQDTIQSPSNNQDSSVVGTLEIQIPDTSEEFSSGLNDTLATKKIQDTDEKIIRISDSGKTEIKKDLVSTKKLSLSQNRVNDFAVKKQKKLSWNTPEDFAKKIFSHEKVPGNGFQSFASDTMTTYTEIQKKEWDFFKRFHTNTDWIFWTYIIIALLFLWIQVFYRKYFTSLFNSSISYHMSSKLFNERTILARRVSVVLNFIYTVSLSLVIYKIFQYLGIQSKAFDRFSLFLIILNLIILYSISKTILQKVIGFFFDKLDQINEYLHNVYVYNKILGIFLLPLSFAAYYTPVKITEILVAAAILFYVFSLLFKIIRGFQIIIKNDVFIFYSILYLCTLEILPIIIGIKIFKTLT